MGFKLGIEGGHGVGTLKVEVAMVAGIQLAVMMRLKVTVMGPWIDV